MYSGYDVMTIRHILAIYVCMSSVMYTLAICMNLRKVYGG